MDNFINLCKDKIKEVENARVDKIKDTTDADIFVVWSCKTLQNKKALLSTTFKGAYYYEFTLNGDVNTMYMDVYQKVKNQPFAIVE